MWLAARWPDYAIDHCIFQESLVVAASAEVRHGWEEAEYLTLGKPGCYEWLAECTARWPELRRRITRDLSSVATGLYAAYFGGNPERVSLPKRVGYIAGYRAVT